MFYWVDFKASIQIEADNEEKARERLLTNVLGDEFEFVEVDSIEEIEEEEEE